MVKLSFVFILISFQSFAQIDCSIYGSGKGADRAMDSIKNRSIIPDSYKEYSFDELASKRVTDIILDSSISFTGYCLLVKDGGLETCECKINKSEYFDTHIELTKDATYKSNRDAIVVEINWRVRQVMASKGIDWSTKTLKKQLVGHMVHVGGLPFFDAHHKQNSEADEPDGTDIWRVTTLEIHPCAFLEVE